MASHDLRSSLRAIDNLAKWIDEDLGEGLSGDSRQHMDLLHGRIQRMDRLLDDLLERGRAGRETSALGTVEARPVVEGTIHTIDMPNGFVVEAAGTADPFEGYATPFATCIRNLIDNALKHHDSPSGRVDVGISDDADQVQIAISDDGPGIPSEHQERIFAMFQRPQSRDAREGSGVGLALVRKLADRHGGRIPVASTPGEGATFTLSWPKQAIAAGT